MSLTAREIERVVGELQAAAGGFVQKVSVIEPRAVYLEVRQPGVSHLLLLCAEQGRTRVHFTRERPPAPEPPFAFQGLLRAELVGMRLDTIEASEGERLVTLRFSGKERLRAVVAELTGRHGNLFLLDEAGVVRGSAVPNLSQRRDNRPGRPYVPPFTRESPPTSDLTVRFTPSAEPFSLSRQIERAYATHERQERIHERRRVLQQSLSVKRRRLARTIEKVEGDVERAGRADEHRRRGELLKANLFRLQRGMSEVTLAEYTEEGVRDVTLPLDPARGPKENLEREFHHYRRLLAGQARANSRLHQLREELQALDARIASVTAMTDDELSGLAAVPDGARPAIPGRRKTEAARPYREVVSPSGQKIRIGRGAKENDALTFRYSNGNDLWLHARHVPGAHVVVPLGRDETPRDETLRDAALLAAHHSDARGEAVEVAFTRVKYVRKQKGAPGAVTFSQDKTVLVRPDAERLARLLSEGE